ncbi:MAG: glycosyltransferase [Parcubacteria group bacterium]
MLSIIIPTLNEEKHLPDLLKSIKGQNFSDYEIIIADAGSADRTLEVAKNSGCMISKGGLPGIGKNKGAEIARGDVVLFVDADVVLSENFFSKALEEFKKRNLEAASFYLQSNSKIHNFIFSILYNFPSKIGEKILPQAMSALMVEKRIHRKIGGFDEKIKIGEELDYVRRSKKYGNFGILKSVRIFISSRRFQKDGWISTWLKYFLCQTHMLFFGPVRSDIFGYKFNHYKGLYKKARKN